jgi:uncharacterized protein with HEPN domain
MAHKSAAPPLLDIVQAVDHIRTVVAQTDPSRFEADWREQWLVERGLEIVSEDTRNLPDELKNRHPEIPWQRIAAIGNRLRHEYHRVLPDILWKVTSSDLSLLEQVRAIELEREQTRDQDRS